MELIEPGWVISYLGMIGLDAHHCPAVGCFVGQLDGTTGRRQIVANLAELGDAVGFHTIDDKRTVIVKLGAIQVAVGIKKA
jgi:hypothetical protein